MLRFCPNCHNMLSLGKGPAIVRFQCNNCPYIFNITKRLHKRLYFQAKELDDIMGGAQAWENVDSTAERCPKCEHPRAYFMQIQTRSGDEPMTTFYKCCNHQCSHQWKIE